jgi:acetyltransferase-like isoleucine patch superfamily enzyme
MLDDHRSLVRRKAELLRGRWLCWSRGIAGGRDVRIATGSIISRQFGGEITLGRRVHIHSGAMILTYGGDIAIGDDVTVNPYTILYGLGGLTIGRGVRIAAHVVVVPANHQVSPDKFIFEQPETRKGIVIGDDVWIGSGARVLDGVTLETGTVIGAGAVVTRSTEPYGIYGGVPARKIGDRGQRGVPKATGRD